MEPTLYMLVMCTSLGCRAPEPPRYTFTHDDCLAKATAYRQNGLDARCRTKWNISPDELGPPTLRVVR
jgi:hypothetical protein